jgi:DNA-binding NarL/FixJ family response regulator
VTAPVAPACGPVATAQAACQALDQAETALRMALSARSDAIRQLAAQGMTVRAIGDIVGLSHSRVALILRNPTR